jgi:hypothetical protein
VGWVSAVAWGRMDHHVWDSHFKQMAPQQAHCLGSLRTTHSNTLALYLPPRQAALPFPLDFLGNSPGNNGKQVGCKEF